MVVDGNPRCLLGDLNVRLKLKDKEEGSSIIDILMREFKECMDEIEVSDVNKSRLHFTWNQNLKGNHGVLKNLYYGEYGFL